MSSRNAVHRCRPTLAVLVLAGLGTAAAHAGTTTGSLAVTSDYVFRGLSQTNQAPALQGGLEYAADSGFYAGAWGSNVSWLSDASSPGARISNSLELDAYAGYRGRLSGAVGFDVGALYYWYPGDYPAGFNSPDTAELYLGLSAGVFALKYSYALTDLFGYADSGGSGYLDLAANWEFAPGWTLNARAGKQWVENNEDFGYADWKLGATRSFDNGFAVALAYTGTDADEARYTNAHGNFLGEDTVVLTVSKGF
ncbi:TorF family putative porin [Vulcaniibacterium tengchongense]|uniref:Uncharacterized protein (TIGR02001 family) n=1 Tax=Vulcaniibacterium tengchongense TaxID=1273429 RepID=A0A3N4VAL2_9GAMM|nr:TorF family putative porin [Vulcaniibacterium tengchongense]RPE80046.1 uncharacterized protein (TIGR02001 family) [Vulcaniibacterium tengchongense]